MCTQITPGDLVKLQVLIQEHWGIGRGPGLLFYWAPSDVDTASPQTTFWVAKAQREGCCGQRKGCFPSAGWSRVLSMPRPQDKQGMCYKNPFYRTGDWGWSEVICLRSRCYGAVVGLGSGFPRPQTQYLCFASCLSEATLCMGIIWNSNSIQALPFLAVWPWVGFLPSLGLIPAA